MSFEKGKIFLVPTDNKAEIGDFVISKHCHDNSLHSGIKTNESEISEIRQHMYVTSDEKIHHGEWYFNTIHNKPFKCIHVDQYFENEFKIVATDDESLTEWTGMNADVPEYRPLPKPSKLFMGKYIREYNNGNIIVNVLIEYETWTVFTDSHTDIPNRKSIKIENEEIFITTPKEIWNRDEHCIDMQYYMEYCLANGYVTPMKWLDELKHY